MPAYTGTKVKHSSVEGVCALIADLQFLLSCASFTAHASGLAPSTNVVPAAIPCSFLPRFLAKQPLPAFPADRTSTRDNMHEVGVS